MSQKRSNNNNKFPFSNELEQAKYHFKKMIDEMSDAEFIDFIMSFMEFVENFDEYYECDDCENCEYYETCEYINKDNVDKNI